MQSPIPARLPVPSISNSSSSSVYAEAFRSGRPDAVEKFLSLLAQFVANSHFA
jgi:hypothetical protein